jgi:hypothetical protein
VEPAIFWFYAKNRPLDHFFTQCTYWWVYEFTQQYGLIASAAFRTFGLRENNNKRIMKNENESLYGQIPATSL